MFFFESGNRNFSLFENIGERASVLNTLRMSKLLNSIPQVAEEDVRNIKLGLKELSLYGESNLIDEKQNALHALGLDYNPRMPIEEYLDIIMPRRKKVNALIEELLASKDKDRLLSGINDQIWKINDELSSSKKVEMLTYTSDLVFGNAGLFLLLLAGGLIGYASASFLGCGLGSGLGSVGGYVGSKIAKKRLKMPAYPKKTVEWLKEKIEDPQEKILATALSKDIKVIQVWNIRRKLKEDS